MSKMLAGNAISLLRNGVEFFPALEQAINHAKFEILLETYIFEPDAIGQRIAAALKQAAARGVAVAVLLDGFGCKELARDFVNDLEATGVEVLFYRPRVSPWTLQFRRLRRLHRKLAVIDGLVGFAGGINIIDDMNTPGHTPPRIDYAVQVAGPLVTPMRATMRRLWRRTAWSSLRKTAHHSRQYPIPNACGNMQAAFIMRDNIWHRRDIEHAYLAAIENAREEILIANSYFLPGRRFRHALMAAVKRGVRVRLVLQARVEYWLLDYAMHALYTQLLSAGIEIHEYHASFMHSKVAVIDRQWATVGSSNIDPFSLSLAREANIVVENTAFAHELWVDLETAIQSKSHLVKLDDWQTGHYVQRALSWLAFALVRTSLGLIGQQELS